MSYILEALKKVEEKREREASAKLPTFSGEQAPDRKKRAVWPYFLLAALLLNAGIIIWWAVPGRPDKQQIVPPAPQIALQQPSAALPKTVDDKDHIPANAKEITEKKDVSKPTVSVLEKGARSAPLPAAEKPSAPERLQPAPPAPRTEADKKQVPTDKVFSINELPESVKGALPQFKVSGYAYSPEPQTRVARINDKILQEGQELAPGLKVEEIVPNGIILSYQGYRFRIGINENR